MVFKLVRTDCEEPRKILLPIGTHLIGRGKLLDCDDKRVSRNHGQLEITDDSIVIKALHQNPCFYTKKGTLETQVLKQNVTLELGHRDKFALLPNTFWYEVLHCTSLDVNESTEQTNNVNESSEQTNNVNESTEQTNNINESTEQTNNGGNAVQSNIETQIIEGNGLYENVAQLQNGVTNGIGGRTLSDVTEVQEGRATDIPEDAFGDDDDELMNLPDLNESLGNVRAGSPSMIPRDASPSLMQGDGDNAQPPPPQHLHQPPASIPSPSKRCLNDIPQSDDNIKKVKIEPVDIKQEPEDVKPGPSQLGAPNPDPAASASNPNVQPTGPPARERCWYGASCYRKNPQHKVQFCHPSDPDWGGSVPKAPCPYGRDCRKPDPRHWRDHDHPPEARQPAHAQGVHRPAKRRAAQKRKKASEDEDEESGRSDQDTPVEDLIVTGKRQRKPVKRPIYDGSDMESENEDPYATDESDDWKPDGVKASQDSSFDTQDF